MQQTVSPCPPSPPRALPRRNQALIVLILALCASMLLGLRSKGAYLLGSQSEVHAVPNPQPAATPGTFRPTPAQLASLTLTPVARMTFRTEQERGGDHYS